MTQNEFPKTAYTVSIIAGALMVASSIIVMIASLAFALTQPTGYYYGPMMFGRYGGPFFMFGMMSIFGLVSGIIVIVSALMLRKSTDYTVWGILIIVFSIFSFFGMGGFVIGAVLGIVGGALALSWKTA
ncbi:MAG: hypothetical protein JRN26_05455 [Nitrososphaerota archaeon]|jgi:hypothetical protein|nr:DUF6114 domain-containing protein [Nitrososphaerota archaeon]MDG6928204.1 hypothetical protein [Nitrososphaerota archaeon]MDG6930966.1 hypothetical protein [Nitrososphaerota archaeon]MDG6932022.1 hypothetical protein [Nitrososphaerota archaeon]MDG6936310.1 hypothetical protein [Nitrososphaerota archaeon]